MKMKVALIYPGDTPTFYPPLGILSIGTVLKEKGFDVEVRDLSFDKLRYALTVLCHMASSVVSVHYRALCLIQDPLNSALFFQENR